MPNEAAVAAILDRPRLRRSLHACRAASFARIWVGLALFSWDALKRARATIRVFRERSRLLRHRRRARQRQERLAQLIAYIFEDAARSGRALYQYSWAIWGILGPDSRSVIARMMQVEANGFDSLVIKGNHEELMLTAYDRPEGIDLYHWKVNGGDTTIASKEHVNGVEDD